MKLAILALVTLVAVDAATPTKPVSVAKDCTQTERQAVNKLLRQDVNPAKACYQKAKGDITVLSTSRLCPIAECRTWIDYMAEKAPDCVYDDTNYGREFHDKAEDCADPAINKDPSATPKPAGDADKNVTSVSGSGSEAGVTSPTTKPKTTKPSPTKIASSSGSGSSGSTEIEIPSTTPTQEPEVTTAPPSRAPSIVPAPTTSIASAAVSASCAIGAAVIAMIVA